MSAKSFEAAAALKVDERALESASSSSSPSSAAYSINNAKEKEKEKEDEDGKVKNETGILCNGRFCKKKVIPSSSVSLCPKCTEFISLCCFDGVHF